MRHSKKSRQKEKSGISKQQITCNDDIVIKVGWIRKTEVVKKRRAENKKENAKLVRWKEWTKEETIIVWLLIG